MKLNHTIWILLLALLAGVPSWAQDVVCSADPYGVYSVDTDENNGEGSINALYTWSVVPPGAVITENQGPNGSSNVISVDWSLVAPGTYTLEVIETDTITGCIGEPVSIEVVIEEPLQPQVTCLALSISEVSFSWDALVGANFYELEVLVNGAPFGFENNFIGTEYIVSGLSPGDEVTLNVMPFGDPESCFEMGFAVCNSIDCLPLNGVEDVTICDSELPYTWNGSDYSAAGSYEVTLQTAAGCDSIATLNLIVNPVQTGSEDVTVCDSELPYTWNGSDYSAAGSYEVTLQTAAGCDSIATLNLIVIPAVTGSEDVTICDSDLPYTWNGSDYSAAGSYDVTLQTAAGCDSIATLNLIVNPVQTGSEDVTVCDSELPYTWNGSDYSAAGSYDVTLQTAAGCDSIATLNLIVIPAVTGSEDVTICDSELPYTWNGSDYNAAGSYEVTLQTAAGCDSIATLNLIVNPAVTGSEDVTICDSELPYTWNGSDYSAAGSYEVTLQTAAGCDSIATLNLIVNPVQTGSEDVTVCDSELPYTWNGSDYSAAGSYEVTLQTAAGCDSIATLNLIVIPAVTGSEDVTICDSDLPYTWNGSDYSAAGSYDVTLQTAAGCDSIATLNLIVNPVQTGSEDVTVCDSELPYTWNGSDYSAAGSYEVTLQTAAGCDSIATLNLIVIPAVTGSEDVTICDSDLPYTWNGSDYSAAGSYDVTLQTAAGCDSIATLNLIVIPAVTGSEDVTICDSELPYTWNGSDYSAAGSYEVTLQTAAGCDSIATLNLIVNPVQTGSEDVTVCDSELPYTWNGSDYSAAGSYEVTLQTAAGCDSIATLNLIVIPAVTGSEDVTICDSDLPYTWNGSDYSAAGSYDVTLQTAAGCDSIATLNLIVNPVQTGSEDVTVCDSELPYTWNGSDYSAAGSYEVTLQTAAGCDSIATLNLIVIPAVTGSEDVTICDSDLPYTWNGSDYSAAGSYDVTLQTAAGCDSIATLNLIVIPAVTGSEDVTICDSELPYTWNGSDYNSAGSYEVTLQTAAGCDSIAALNLIVNPAVTGSEDVIICDSELPYTWNGSDYSAAGSYEVTLQTAAGCDSIATLNLIVIPAVTGSEDVTICDSELPYTWNGIDYSAAGSYEVTLQTAAGCDSIATLNLIVNPVQTGSEDVTVCDSELPYTWNGSDYSAAGSYEVTLQTAAGCDSIATLNLIVIPAVTGSEDVTICDSDLPYTWNGSDYSAAGSYDVTLQTAAGCDSIATLNLIVNPVQTGSEDVTVCDSELPYTWNGSDYSAAGSYEVTLQTAAGCDSIATLNLIVIPAVTGSEDVTICDSDLPYTWNGSDYSAAGSYDVTLQTAAGCDSIATLNLIVIPAVTGSEDVTICDSELPYTWNGSDYSAAGSYDVTLQTTAGCDSIATLNLIVIPAVTGSEDVTICDSELPYTWNGSDYSAAGSYDVTLQTAAGCDSIATLNLIVNPAVTGSEDVTICDSELPYTWNGSDYNAAGSYDVTLQTTAGCDSIATLNLIVIPAVTGSEDVTICDSELPYTWNGSDYNAAGSYEVTLQTAAGCDSIATLNLIVNPAVTGSEDVTICDSDLPYTWNGSDYSAAGSYDVTLQTAAGCDSIATLNLIVNPAVTGSEDVTICDSDLPYTWNGSDYNAAGSYEVTLQTAAGCDSIATLNLIVNPAVTGSEDVTICDSDLPYTWNGSDYSAAGSYDVTLQTAAGCDSIATLNLIVNIAGAAPELGCWETATLNDITCEWEIDGIEPEVPVIVNCWDVFEFDAFVCAWVNIGIEPEEPTAVNCWDDYQFDENSCSWVNQGAPGDVPVAGITASAILIDCDNPSVTLVASGNGSYEWQDASGNAIGSGASFIVSQGGTYTLVVTASNGCFDQTQVTIDQDSSTPSVSIDASALELNCETTSITLTATATVSGGSFAWSNGAGNTNTISVSAAGDYEVVFTADNGCEASDIITISEDAGAPQIQITASNADLTCDVTEITLTATGGDTYEWSTGETGPSIVVTAAGPYSVTGTTANGCDDIANIVVGTDTQTPVATISSPTLELTCELEEITLTATGGGSYDWNNGLSNTASLLVSSPGFYTVVVESANGCTDEATVEVTQNADVPVAEITASANEITCDVPSIILTGSGGVSFSWNGGLSNEATLEVTELGTYSLVVTALNGCQATEVIQITQDTEDPSVSITNLDGTNELTCTVTSINVQATGATTYAWSDGLGFSDVASITQPGTYVVTGTGDNGCTSTAQIDIVSDGNLPVVDIINNSGTNTLTCVVTEISVTVSSSIIGDITWSNGLGSNPDQIFDTPGTYSVSVVDPSTGCEGTASITIGEDVELPIPQIFNATGEDVITCIVESIDLFATGGDSYEWQDELGNVISTTDELTVYAGGVYTVSVTASNGCSDLASYTITESLDLPVVDITATIVELTCTNPSATLTATGGGTYTWSNGLGGAASVDVVTAGDYSVLVTADNGCEQTATISITENLVLPGADITADNDELNCVTTQASLTVSGNGTIEWGGGLGSDETISVSTPGIYTAVVTGSNGCVSNAQYEITQDITPVVAQVTPASAQLTCELEEITLSASGGVNYSWSNGLTGAVISVTAPDLYTVIVTGENGCTDEASVNVTQSADLPVVTIVASDDTLSCSDVSSVLTASGASTYAWTDASGNAIGNGASLVVTAPGVYSVSGLAANGCTGGATFEVFGDFALPVATITNVTGTDVLTCVVVEITLEVEGGSSYQWSNNLGTNAIVNITNPGLYDVTVTGLNGCEDVLQYEITEDVDAPVVVIDNLTGTTELTCSIVAIDVLASGGFTYEWDNGLGFGAAQTLTAATDYEVTVTGQNGCVTVENVTITQNLAEPAIQVTNASGSNQLTCTNASITLVASGGVTYEWFDESGVSLGTDATLNAIAPGIYTVEGIGVNGCEGSATYEILENVDAPTLELVNITGETELTCAIESINVEVVYASGTLVWNSTFGSSDNVTITEPGLYEVTLTAPNGCTNVASISITEDVLEPGAAITNLTGETELNCVTTLIELEGAGNGTVAWSGGQVVGNITEVTAEGNYTLTVTGVNGCQSTDVITITSNNTIPVAAITTAPSTTVIDCINQEIVLTASGGVSFEWTDASGVVLSANSELLVNAEGEYTVEVTSENGCTDVQSIFITENIQLPIVTITNVPNEFELTCSLTEITLNASGSDTYEWTDFAGNVVGTGDALVVSSPGTYVAVGTLDNGCVSDNQVVITQDIQVPGAFITNVTGASTLTCLLNEIQLEASGNGSFSWSDGSVVLSNTADLTVGAIGTYTVTVTGTNGCTSEASVTIGSDGNIPVVSITNVTNEDVLTCDVTEIVLEASGAGTFEWTNALGVVVSSTSDLTVSQPGDYEVTLTATNGCSASTSVSIAEDVALPTVNIVNTTGTDELTCDVTSIDLTATGGVSYVWSGGELSESIAVSNDGTYTVTATGANGCSTDFSVIITEDVVAPTMAITNITDATVLTCDVTSIDVVANGATDYIWTNEAGAVVSNDAALTISAAGEYTVEGTSDNGCSSTATIIITEDVVDPIASINNLDNTTTLTCQLNSIDLQATGGVEYSWSDGSVVLSTTADLMVGAIGTYTVTVTGANGCTSEASVTIDSDGNIPVVSITNVTNEDVLTCDVTQIVLQASGAGTFEWTNAVGAVVSSTSDLIVSQPGDYEVTLTATNGCSASTSVSLAEDVALPTVNIVNTTGTDELTCDVTSIDLTATGGVSYVWSGGELSESITVSNDDTYTVTATGANGCSTDFSIIITEDVVAPTMAITNITDATVLTCDVTSIDVVANGATDYVWTNEAGAVVSNDATLTISAAGEYTVEGTSDNGCSSTATIIITEDVVDPIASINNLDNTTTLTCQLNSIDLQATGGVDYSWSDAGGVVSNTANLTVGAAGTYTVTVIGSNGCSSEASITIGSDGNLPSVSINASALNLDCVLDEITLTANATGAVTWSNGLGTNTSIVVTEPGTYTVTTLGTNGCEAQSSVVITQDITPVVAGIVNNTGTTQLANGVTAINVTATGGGTYSWDNGLGNSATVDLTATGVYIVTVTGDNGCVDTESITITNCTPPTVAIVSLDGTSTLTCSQLSIDVQASGADNYVWSNSLGNLSTATISAPGVYTVTGTTADGCSADATITIDQNSVTPVAAILPPPTTELTCLVNTIALTATGGGTYAWSNGLGNAANAVVGSAGTYIVTVTADNGCTDTESITITDDGSLPSASIVNNTGTTVLNCATTSISVTAQGGVSYSWDNGLGNNANATITSAGTYTVTATAGNGCTATSSITVTEDLGATAGINNTSGTAILSCAQTSINVTATGGVAYAWDGGLGNAANATITLPGTYTVTVTAANGCVDTESIVVTNDGSAPSIAITNTTGTTVLDCNVEQISLTATGGSSYTWDNGLGSNASVVIAEPGTYTVTSQASNGCSGTSSVVITENVVNPVAGINTPATTELTCTVNSIALTATGGGTYAWDNGLGNAANATVGAAGTYTVTVTADNGCVDSESITITDDGSIPTASIVNNTGTTILTCTTTAISVTATGGSNYAWSGGLGNAANATITLPGTYTVTVSDANGCSSTASINVTQDNAISAAITADAIAPIIDCNNPDIVLTAAGGGTYTWSNGLGSGSSITATSQGVYTVTVTGANGCTDEATYEVLGNFNLPNVGITNNSGTTVLGCSTNSISLTATGAVSYQWSNNLSSVAALTATTPAVYTVTGTGANGCVQTASVTITQDTSTPIAGITSSPNSTVLTCSQPIIVLTATGQGTYTWAGGEETNSITVASGGTYSVTVTGSNGCTDTESITITENLTGPLAQIINASGNTQLSCSVNAIDVTATGGGTYSWSGGLGSNTAVSLTQPGTYTVTVTALNGCTDTESITITDDGSLPQIIIEAITSELNCSTTEIVLNAVGDDGVITWSVDGEDCPGAPNTDLICSDFFDPVCGCDGITYSNPCYAERDGGVLAYLPGECGSTDGASSITVNNPGVYTVTLDVNGCVATYSFTVEENLEIPTADVTADTPICSNSDAEFVISGTAGDVVTYTTDGGLTNQTITIDATNEAIVTIPNPALDVSLSLVEVARQTCVATLDESATVEVISAPVANASGPAFALCEGLVLALTSQEVAGATYSWSGPGGFASTQSDVFIPNADSGDAGEYVYSVSVGSCTDYDTVNVAIASPTSFAQAITICIGQSYTLPDGTTVSAEGVYTSNIFNAAGCDSVVTTTLAIVDEFIIDLNPAICDGEAYEMPDGTSVSDEGVYTFEFISSGGCDSTVIVTLDVNPVYYSLSTQVICDGETFTLADGTAATTSGLYEVAFNSAAGCDSIIAVQLNVLPLPEPVNVNYDLCFGESVTLQDGSVVTDAGSYPVVLQTANGCDSLIVNNVNVWPNYSDTIEVVICHDEQYELPNGLVVSDAGDYVQFEGQSANGCDSIFVITVIELDPIVQQVVENLCYNGSYVLPDGTSAGADGLYEFVLISATGCDSLVSIQLEVAEQIYGEPEQVLLCFGETHTLPSGDVVSENGEYTSVLSTVEGCDSLIVSSVVALDYIFTEVADFACQGESYTLPSGQSVTNSGVYQSILTNEVGCDSTVQVTLTFTPQVIVSIIPEVDSVTVCAGDTLQLIADGAAIFNWSSANALSQNDGAIVEAYPTTDGYITVSGSNQGCSAVDSIYVGVNALPEMQIVAPDAICMGDSVLITAEGADSILWLNNDYLECLTCADNLVAPIESTVFTVGGFIGQCYGSTSFTMEVQSLPVASVFGDTLVCAYSPAQLYAAGGESYLWNNGATTSSISVEPGETTVYQVVAISGICADTTTITVEAIPLPQITTNNDTIITLGGEVQLFATGGVNYSWSPADDLSCSVCANPLAIPSESTTYCVEVMSELGCSDSACVRIEVSDECETFFIPNAFAPERGGHELNDCFRPFGEECFAAMRMRVFDRWGELVFESTSFDECWDGNYQGKKVNSGVFVYYFDGILINGDPFYRKGNVTVIR